MKLITECKVFKLSESLYQCININGFQIETIVTMSGEWSCTIKDTYTDLVLDAPAYELTDDVAFQYGIILTTSTIDYLIIQHKSLRDLLFSMK